MSTFAALHSDIVRIPIFRLPVRRRRQCPKHFVSPVMKDDSRIAANDRTNKNEGISKSNRRSEPPRVEHQSRPSDLRFDRLQPSDDELDCKHKKAFGRYIAREALIDEEFWMAAWLRAECHWEDKSGSRHTDTFKRQFAEQEFNAIKRRCTGQQLIQKSTCIIAVKKDEPSVKRTVMNSVVGTLDINIRHLLCGETFPGEHMKNPFSCGIFGRKYEHVYAYVANLSVAKYARCRGIASNMLLLAVEVATSYGVNEVFVHVLKDNMVAQNLYEKLGFKAGEMVEKAKSQSLEEQKYLLCWKPAQLTTPYNADT